MSEEPPEKPLAPDLPKYLRKPLEKQSPERLVSVATYATELAEWKRYQRQQELERRRAEEAVDDEKLDKLDERDLSTDPEDYGEVPVSGAYITVKETKPGFHYFYWQWREGDTWKNEYIAPVNPKQ